MAALLEKVFPGILSLIEIDRFGVGAVSVYPHPLYITYTNCVSIRNVVAFLTK